MKLNDVFQSFSSAIEEYAMNEEPFCKAFMAVTTPEDEKKYEDAFSTIVIKAMENKHSVTRQFGKEIQIDMAAFWLTKLRADILSRMSLKDEWVKGIEEYMPQGMTIASAMHSIRTIEKSYDL